MFKNIFAISAVILLLACSSKQEGVDYTVYDLYQESQFANGFALIKDNYGKRLDPNHNAENYFEGIIHASVMFGEMDLLEIKKQVIAKMVAQKQDEKESVWAPLYDEIKQTHGHVYDMLYGLVYYTVFNPQVEYGQFASVQDDPLAVLASLTATSRMNPQYWHNKIEACVRSALPEDEQKEIQASWFDALKDCQKEYTAIIGKMAAEIYPKLQEMPQYRKNN